MSIAILLAALAVVESGTPKHPEGNDRAIGKHGEVSRYQITPKVWMSYARWMETPSNHRAANAVAVRVFNDRCNDLWLANGPSVPTPEIIYVLWHRPGIFAARGYDLKRMPKVVQERCKRFAALCRELEEKGTK